MNKLYNKALFMRFINIIDNKNFCTHFVKTKKIFFCGGLLVNLPHVNNNSIGKSNTQDICYLSALI